MTTCGENDHAVLSAIKLLEKADIKDEDSITEITNSCKTVKSECEKGLAEKVLATKHNGYDVLIKLAENSTKNSNQSNNSSSSVKRESSNDSIATGDLIGGVSADISDESMKFLIQALQKTVEDSKKVREEYEIEKANRSKAESRIAPKPSAGPKKPSKSSKVTKSASTTSSKAKRKEPSKPKEPTFNPEAEMQKLLSKVETSILNSS